MILRGREGLDWGVRSDKDREGSVFVVRDLGPRGESGLKEFFTCLSSVSGHVQGMEPGLFCFEALLVLLVGFEC